jgi:hypothetical protein
MVQKPAGLSRYLPAPILSQLDPLFTPQPISLRSILIPFSYLRLSLPSGLFPPSFPTNTLYNFPLLFLAYHMSRPPHSSSFDHLGMSTKYEAPQCATSFILLLLHPSFIQKHSWSLKDQREYLQDGAGHWKRYDVALWHCESYVNGA